METTFKVGDSVQIVGAVHQPWLWNGMICQLLEKVGIQWKLKTEGGHICYFDEDKLQTAYE